jgi:hypothetical protein
VRIKDTRPVIAWEGEPPAVRTADKPARAAKAIIEAARRGPEMASVVETTPWRSGRRQLASVIMPLIHELASRSHSNGDNHHG